MPAADMGGDGARRGHADGWVGELVAAFLANRSERSRDAYTADLEEFSRFVGSNPTLAVAQLLGCGGVAGDRLVVEYAADLRRLGRARTTIHRRLSTLRALVRRARETGYVDWHLDLPSEEAVSTVFGALQDGDMPYLIPRHSSEIDRLDLQHHALQQAIGANHLAPVRAATRVLDVGSGTGQWGFEMCGEFPEALVVGLDLVAGKPGGPSRYRCVRGNLLKGLPFGAGQFDLVHQRLLFLGIPSDCWPAVVADLVRVTRPGGWVELVELPFMGLEPAGPAIERLRALFADPARRRGLDTTGSVFRSLDRWLRDAGLLGVNRREFRLPVGEWGGNVGSLMATDCRTGFTHFCEVLEAQGRIAAGEWHDLLQRVQEEYEERQVTTTVAITFGRKPVGGD